MNGEDRESIQQLLAILRDHRAVLFAGAGCSKIAGYPLWAELIDKMSKTLAPSLTMHPNMDSTVYADQIKDQMVCAGLEKDYYKYLERTFQPQPEKNHTPFHCALVQLGFSGIVTTNYDILLECAVGESFATNSNLHSR